MITATFAIAPTSKERHSAARDCVLQAPDRPVTDDTPRLGRACADVRLARAYELLEDETVSVLSLDVFDTLLWRRATAPVEAFPIVGARLAERGQLGPQLDPIAFRKLRILAEERARRVANEAGRGVEVTLDDIYAQIPAMVLNHAPPEEAVAAELEVERELLAPDLDMMELVRAARTAGKLVIAVSDTYLSEVELRSLLDPHFTLETAIDRVFASSEHGEGKTRGLFEIVLAELGKGARELVHVGDNEHADVESPRRLGIRAVHFDRMPKQLELVVGRERRYVDQERVWQHGDFGLTAARAKVLHRRERGELPPELSAFWSYGATALGPALTGFAEWVQDRASVAGVGTVHCLMREGELLAKLVNGAGTYLDSDVRAQPMWLSRQVCARASIFEGTPGELRTLLSRRRPPLVRELCETLHVALDVSAALRPHAEGRLNQPALVEEVFGELTGNPELRGPMVSEARLLRERVVEYLRARLPGAGQPLMLVDLGWGGTIQMLLQKILDREGIGVRTCGLYLVTHDVASERLLEGLDISGYLAGSGVPGPPVRAIMRSPEILEQVCMPDVGSQVDLTSDLEPVLSEAIDEALVQSAERGAAQSGILAFQREWGRYAELAPGFARLLHEDARRLLLAQVARACAAPTNAEAGGFGRWIHDENFGSTGSEPIVGGPHATRAFRHMDPQSLIALPMSELYWPFGLAALEDEHLAAAAEAVTMDRLSPETFASVVETGDFEVFYDTGFGYGEAWKVACESRRNRFGLSHIRLEVPSDQVPVDELRGVRLDPVSAPSILRIDWVALTCWLRDEPLPREVLFDTPESLARLAVRGASPLGPKLWLVPGDDPQFDCDLRAAVGEGVYRAVVECAFAVMPAAPAPEDPGGRELARHVERRSRALKRLVRQAENRSGVPVGAPLRKGWRRVRARLGR